ncbi:MAG: leucyl aminopeptidase [Propionibacteriales bacterium]|nr:leucyl aminopeptidase [Propionibacteriales bacterium]
MTTYTLRKAAADRVRTDLVVIGVAVGAGKALVPTTGAEPVAEAYGRGFAPMLAAAGFGGSFGEAVRVPTHGTINAGQLLVVGVGNLAELTAEKVRRAAGVAARNIGNVASVTLALPAEDVAGVRAVIEGFSTGLYRYETYKSKPTTGGIADVVVLTDGARRAEVVAARDAAVTLTRYADQARDWVNTPPNALVPRTFADQIKKLGDGTAVEFELLTAAQLKKSGAGGIIGVGQGSANPPCLVKLTWAPDAPRGSVALVGKGITFDSGGLTIKPGGSMPAMKSDMAGAATVVAAIHTLAALEVPVTVTAYVPIAENMVSGTAQRPGDVLKMLSGKTVEVTNTDAEGRLVLADALTLAVRDEPEVIINVATLTGACVMALGDRIAGLFGDDRTTAEVQRAADSTGELFWRLPIPAEQRTSVRTESKVADLLQANWVRWGGALYAAAFLEQFVEDVPWAHLDVAGPAYNTGGPWGHVPSGGTGFSISTIVELVSARAAS